MIKSIILLSYIKLIKSYLLIKNVDVEPFTLKVLDGSNGFRYSYLINAGDNMKMTFYGRAIRLWAQWSDTVNDKGFTLFEFTRVFKSEPLAVMDISFVDGFNSNIKLISNSYNISTNFGSNTCSVSGGLNRGGCCISPCLTYNADFLCCKGKYSTPQTCSRFGEPIAYENKVWRNTIRTATIPPLIYTYSYDDDSGTLKAFDEQVEIHFWKVGVVNTISN